MSQQLNAEQAVNHAIARATALGAQEARASVGHSVHVSLTHRDGKLEKTSQATTQGLSISLLVDDRYSAHSTSDMRPEALESFLQEAVAATRYLEPDPDRRMAPRDQMGAGDLAALELEDPGFGPREPATLREDVASLDAAIHDLDPGDLISAAAHLWEVRSEGFTGFSNGFSIASSSTSFGRGGELTFREPGGRLPEAYSFYSAHHLDDVPPASTVAAEVWERADLARGSSACASGRYPMFLANRSAGRVLSSILGPLSGGAIWQKQSCYLDKLGEQLADPGFSIWDEPSIPRAPGSHVCDGDGFPARRRAIFEDGVLKTFFIGLYHARKLGVTPTTGGASNLIMAPGERAWQDLAAEMPRAIYVTSFLGGNANPTTGDFSFGIRGQLLERGEVVQNLSEMNISGNILELLRSFRAAGTDPWIWSSYRVPTLLFDGVQFSGT